MARTRRWGGPLVALVVLLSAAAAVATSSNGGPDVVPPAAAGPSSTTATTSTTAAGFPVPAPRPGTPPDAGPAGALVDTLVVATPDPALPRYERDRFGDDWSYDPASGCNTRERVLIAESLVPAVVDERCRPTGRWTSAYDGVTTTDIADLQIDHLVPLADAWRSGAASWTDERRLAFANDLAQPGTLIAVTGPTNQSKSDSSPDRWLPPDRSAWCAYATDWVAVKASWQLTVTPAEKATLVQVLAGC